LIEMCSGPGFPGHNLLFISTVATTSDSCHRRRAVVASASRGPARSGRSCRRAGGSWFGARPMTRPVSLAFSQKRRNHSSAATAVCRECRKRFLLSRRCNQHRHAGGAPHNGSRFCSPRCKQAAYDPALRRGCYASRAAFLPKFGIVWARNPSEASIGLGPEDWTEVLGYSPG
jgi:hypothetical protein